MSTHPGDRQRQENEEPCYVISVAARMVGVHPQTLRYYERMGLVDPSRSKGNLRLYTRGDVDRLKRIKSLLDDLGMNLAGVEVVLRLVDRINGLDQEVQRLSDEVVRLRGVLSGHALARREDT